MRSATFASLLLAAIVPIAARAAETPAARACRSGDPGSRVAGCTVLLAEARTARQRAIALDGRCWANNDRGYFAAALTDCANAILADPGYPYSHHNRGIALAGIGDHRGAVTAFTQSIELRPALAYQYVNRAKSLHQVGDRAGAVRDYETALRLQPANADARLGLEFVSSGTSEPSATTPVLAPDAVGGGNSLCGPQECN